MPFYKFHLHECGSVLQDDEGTKLADAEAARAFAVRSAREVMAGEVKEGRLCLSCYIRIEADGGTIEIVPFRDVLSVTF